MDDGYRIGAHQGPTDQGDEREADGRPPRRAPFLSVGLREPSTARPLRGAVHERPGGIRANVDHAVLADHGSILGA